MASACATNWNEVGIEKLLQQREANQKNVRAKRSVNALILRSQRLCGTSSSEFSDAGKALLLDVREPVCAMVTRVIRVTVRIMRNIIASPATRAGMPVSNHCLHLFTTVLCRHSRPRHSTARCLLLRPLRSPRRLRFPH